MIVELSFLTGRFHATPWGRHVNEGVPEWPPSPFRFLRALVDAWCRKHSDVPAPAVERLLAAMASVPPVFCLPRARASHTRSYLAQDSEDPTDKKLVFDGFAVLDRDSRVLMGWPGLSLDDETLVVAQRLIGSLNYFGRAESWIDARVLDDFEVAWNCVPLEAGPLPAGKEAVSVAGVVDPEVYAMRGFDAPGKGKTKARRLGWFEALAWGSAETIANTMNRPPALEPIFYLRDSDALDAPPTPKPRTSARLIEAVRFAAESRVPVPITDALRLGEHVHRRLMGSLRKVLGDSNLPSTFSGRDADGRPVRGHTHLSILAVDEDRDGFVDAVLIASPTPLTVEEQRAIDRLKPVERRTGHPLILTPLRFGTLDELTIRVKNVVSMTPFAPYHHWKLKRDGDFDAWLRGQFTQEAEQRGLPRVIEVHRTAPGTTMRRRVRWLDFRRARKDDGPQPAFGLRVEFAEPVRVPFSLGYASHFGLGCFVAAEK